MHPTSETLFSKCPVDFGMEFRRKEKRKKKKRKKEKKIEKKKEEARVLLEKRH